MATDGDLVEADIQKHRFETALRNAHLAGDSRAAHALAAEYKRRFQPEPPPPEGFLTRLKVAFSRDELRDARDQQRQDEVFAPARRQQQQEGPGIAPAPQAEAPAPESAEAPSLGKPIGEALEVPWDTTWEAISKSAKNIPVQLEASAGGLISSLHADAQANVVGEAAQRWGMDNNAARAVLGYADAHNIGIDRKAAAIDLSFATGPDGLAPAPSDAPLFSDIDQGKAQEILSTMTDDEREEYRDDYLAGAAEDPLRKLGDAIMANAHAKERPVNAKPYSFGWFAGGGLNMAGIMAPAILTSSILRNPYVGAGMTAAYFGAQGKGEAFSRAKQTGLDDDLAAQYANLTGLLDATLGTVTVEQMLARRGDKLLKRVFKNAVGSVLTNEIQASLQLGLDKGMIQPDMTWEEAKQTLVQVGVTTPFITAAAHGVNRPIERLYEKRDAKKAARELDQEIARSSAVEALRPRGVDEADAAPARAPEAQPLPDASQWSQAGAVPVEHIQGRPGKVSMQELIQRERANVRKERGLPPEPEPETRVAEPPARQEPAEPAPRARGEEDAKPAAEPVVEQPVDGRSRERRDHVPRDDAPVEPVQRSRPTTAERPAAEPVGRSAPPEPVRDAKPEPATELKPADAEARLRSEIARKPTARSPREAGELTRIALDTGRPDLALPEIDKALQAARERVPDAGVPKSSRMFPDLLRQAQDKKARDVHQLENLHNMLRTDMRERGMLQEDGTPATPAEGERVIGENRDGEDIIEDANGIRHVDADGTRSTEPVALRPTRQGMRPAPRANRPARFEPVEQQGDAAPSTEAPETPARELPPDVRGRDARGNPVTLGIREGLRENTRRGGRNTGWRVVLDVSFKDGVQRENVVSRHRNWDDALRSYQERAGTMRDVEPNQPEARDGQPAELDQPGQETLEGAQPDDVPPAEGGRDAGDGAEGRSPADAGRDRGTGEPGSEPGSGVSDGEGAIPVPARGSRDAGTRSRAGREADDGSVAPGEPGTPDGGHKPRPGESRGDTERVEAQQRQARETPPRADDTSGRPEPVAQRGADIYQIPSTLKLGTGGPKTKFKNNVEAIRILKMLQAEGRAATAEEQALLAQYVGWGGLPQAFFGEDGSVRRGWEREAAQLRDMLTPDEYAAARRSTQDAHFTSRPIVEAIWTALDHMGFQGGRTLEPSSGTGNFIGMMPRGLVRRSQITMVELDSITGGIAKALYPGARVHAPQDFAKFTIARDYFDVGIGNVPFGSQRLYDPANKAISAFSIHNFFFAKSIDSLRPGGVLAMVVSNSFMDAGRARARQYIADRADLIGAIRLPNNAFLKNAGTEVTTDIVFLRKRVAGEDATGESWVNTVETSDAEGRPFFLNEYFAAHPEMMLGEMGLYGSMYGPDQPALVARPGQDTPALLAEAVRRLPEGLIEARTIPPETMTARAEASIGEVKVGSLFFGEGGELRRRAPDMNNEAQSAPHGLTGRSLERARGLVGIRDTLSSLRRLQLSEGATDAELAAARRELNEQYDAFVKRNGFINRLGNRQAMRDDPSWPQLASLERDYDAGISRAVAKRLGIAPVPASAKKSDIFTTRTQQPFRIPTEASNGLDALTMSLAWRGRLDMPYMQELTGKSVEALVAELGDSVFLDADGSYVPRDLYLSGNVKAKLAEARRLAEGDSRYERNVRELEAVQPVDVEPVDIGVRPGASWVPPQDMAGFVRLILDSQPELVNYVPSINTWTIAGRASPSAESQWGTGRVSALKVLRAALQNKAITVHDRHPDGTTTVNRIETDAANNKVEQLAREFQNWIWDNPERRARLGRLYNDIYNTNVQRAYDGSFLQFPGKVSDDIIDLFPTQKNAVWRILQDKNVLLDHVVGAGKTFTVIAGAMEMKRIGRASKPMIAVPNHLVDQWGADFLTLYPGANVLVLSKAELASSTRRETLARVATGDWDAVIVPHSSFKLIANDPQFESRLIQDEIRALEESRDIVREQEGRGSRTVKEIEKQRDSLKSKLERLLDAGGKDDNLTFSELGVDALFVDEAHLFKNLGFATSMTRIAGINPDGSERASDMLAKVRYIQETTGGNVVFATGTPISNSLAEMYTMQRYLDNDTLKRTGLAHFDAWASQFAEVTNDPEQTASNIYKPRKRLSKFVNVPELVQQYRTFADVLLRDDINQQLAAQGRSLNVPPMVEDGPINVVVDRSAEQAAYIGVPNAEGVYPEGSIVWRSEHVPKRPQKGDDNHLNITTDAQKAALDMRIVDPAATDYPDSKVNTAVRNVLELYRKWAPQRGTQLVFVDKSTPKGSKNREADALRELMAKADGGDEAARERVDALTPDELAVLDNVEFSVYDDMRAKLIEAGVPADEIAFIHDHNTDKQKFELFAKVRAGRVRILFGSTAKMGAGMNVQDRLVGLHHIDTPWRPSDLEQREGRILRQGNLLYAADRENFRVTVMRYATKQTLDSMSWQTIETKARLIEQIRKGDMAARTVEDIGGEAANAAAMKAASSGNPLILEEVTLRQSLRRLESDQIAHQRAQHRLQDSIRELRTRIRVSQAELPAQRADAKRALPDKFKVKIERRTFDSTKEDGMRKAAGEALLALEADLARSGRPGQELVVGKYGDFDLVITRGEGLVTLALRGESTYNVANTIKPEQADPTGHMTRLANVARQIPGLADATAQRMRAADEQVQKLEQQVKKWDGQAELDRTRARHDEVLTELSARPEQQEAQGTSDMRVSYTDSLMAMAAGVDHPMPKWVPTYIQMGVPQRPDAGTITLRGKTIKLPDDDNPARVENIRQMVMGIIGPRLYDGRVRGQAKLGFYKRSNSEIRVRNYGQVEVLAHEMAHFLDHHYTMHERFTKLTRDRKYAQQVKDLSYTSREGEQRSEGFAEFVRLWLTNYDIAQQNAPEFTKAFEDVLARDRNLERRMHFLQEEMHKWYRQGPMAQAFATEGFHLSPQQRIERYIQTMPLERHRQRLINRYHAAKVVERTLTGTIHDASISMAKQFQLVNGAEGIGESIVRYGTARVMPDGSLQYNGKGLKQVLEPVTAHGWKRTRQWLIYAKSRRANELMQQGRERSMTQQQIDPGLGLGEQFPEFKTVFDEYRAFNNRMLDFFVDMGYISSDQRGAFQKMNRDYVPFQRIIDSLENPGDGHGHNINARLHGGSQNTREIADNIISGLYANVRGAMIARAKQTMYREILNNPDGAIFASRIAPDSKLIRTHIEEMAQHVAAVMAENGIGVSKDGLFSADERPDVIIDVDDIKATLQENPNLLLFWTHGHAPKSHGKYIDNAIIDGKRVWFEVNSPLIVDMLSGMNGRNYGWLMHTAFRIKNLTTRTITSMLQFMGPNAIRDTQQAMMMSRNRFVPVWDTVIGMGHALVKSDLYKDFMLQGGGYGTRILERTVERRTRTALDLPSSNQWDVAAKALLAWDRFSSSFELGSRIGDYRKGIKQRSRIQSVWEAREIATDFGNRPSMQAWDAFMRTVPFMNAALQSMDLAARRIFEIDGEMKVSNIARMDDEKLKFIMAGSVITAFSVALWLINHDDERYKALTPDQKARFWWLYIPGTKGPITIPKPFELGTLFATIPELTLDYMDGQHGKDVAHNLGWALAYDFGFAELPSLLETPYRIATNKDFRGVPIVPEHMKNLPPRLQYRESTPELYREIGNLLNVSPLQAQAVTRGYLGYVESVVTEGAQMLLWDEKKWGPRPFAQNPAKMMAYQFIHGRVPYRTKWTEGYYQLKTRAAAAALEQHHLQRDMARDASELVRFRTNRLNVTLIAIDRAFRKMDRELAAGNDRLTAIKYSPKLTRKEKETRIEQWYEQKNEVLKQYYQSAADMLRDIEARND